MNQQPYVTSRVLVEGKAEARAARRIAAVGRISLTCWNAQRFQGARSQSIIGMRIACGGGVPTMIGGATSEFL